MNVSDAILRWFVVVMLALLAASMIVLNTKMTLKNQTRYEDCLTVHVAFLKLQAEMRNSLMPPTSCTLR